MKQSFLFILLTIGIMQFVYAQDNDTFTRITTTFGVKGGFNYTSVLDTSTNEDDTSLFAGLFAETRFSKRFGIQYELRYSVYSTTDFIEIPLLAKYYFNEKFNVFLGPRLDFIIDDDTSNSTSFAAEVGLQYNISKHFFIDGSYSLGSGDEVRINQSTLGARSSFRLGFGYRF